MIDIKNKLIEKCGNIPVFDLTQQMTGFNGWLLENIRVSCSSKNKISYCVTNKEKQKNRKYPSHIYAAYPNALEDWETEDFLQNFQNYLDICDQEDIHQYGVGVHVTKPGPNNRFLHNEHANFQFPLNLVSTNSISSESWTMVAWFFSEVYDDIHDTIDMKEDRPLKEKLTMLLNRICSYYGPTARNLYTFECEKDFDVVNSWCVDVNDFILNSTPEQFTKLVHLMNPDNVVYQEKIDLIYQELLYFRDQVFSWKDYAEVNEMFKLLFSAENLIKHPKQTYYFALIEEHDPITTSNVMDK